MVTESKVVRMKFDCVYTRGSNYAM